MRPHVLEAWGAWDDADQRDRLDRSTDPATHEIVEQGGRPIGCQWVRSHPDALELARLWLLTEAQGHGVGAELLRRLCARADEAGLPLRLRVLRANRARRLYHRFGFVVTEETESHFAMERALGGDGV